MAIVVPYNIRKNIDARQRAVFDAIRKTPIYDSEIYVPAPDAEVRCLEFVPDKIAPDVVLPVVFDIHGGGFTNGYPEEDDYICRRQKAKEH